MVGISAPVDDNGRQGWAYYSQYMDSVIAVFKARGEKCQRCWKYDEAVGKDSTYDDVCPRCAEVLRSGVSA